LSSATAIHIFGFNTKKELLLAESEGTFKLKEWQEAYDLALEAACGTKAETTDEDDIEMEQDNTVTLETALRTSLAAEALKQTAWKTAQT
jgi:non-homologous end joining protein Ku